ncbi:MAG: hypothetical protein ACTSVE_08565, partial [Candidatus Helarchaeota archaeon]
MVIHNVWILTKKGGISLYHKKYGSVEVDESLFSGFLSSINTLAESEFEEKGIESIIMGNYKFLYEDFNGILFTVAGDITDFDSELKEFLISVRKRFFEKFSELPWARYLKELARSGEVEIFEQFELLLDESVERYKKEKEEILRNKRDLLEIYENLINIVYLRLIQFSEVVDEDFFEPISKSIKDIIKNDEVMKDVKIPGDGIFFSSIDLNKIEISRLKIVLHEIFEAVMNVGYNAMGKKPINKIIIQLFPAIVIKMDQIQKLGVCYQILDIVLKAS